jgi:pentatricopeptide repeat protein
MWNAMGANAEAVGAPNSTDLSLVVETMCRQARYEKEWYATALQIWESATSERGDGTNQTTTTTADWRSDLPLSTYHALLNEMEHRQEWRQALRLLQQLMERAAPSPTSQTFQQVLGACVRAGQPEQAARVLQQSLDYGPPTLAIFATVIPSLAKKRHWRKALALLQILETHNLTATTKIYNSILVALGKAKEFAQAKRLVSRMKQQDIPRDIYTYNSL